MRIHSRLILPTCAGACPVSVPFGCRKDWKIGVGEYNKLCPTPRAAGSGNQKGHRALCVCMSPGAEAATKAHAKDRQVKILIDHRGGFDPTTLDHGTRLEPNPDFRGTWGQDPVLR